MANVTLDEYTIRNQKLKKLIDLGINPYPDKFHKSHSIEAALKLALGEKNIKIAGRILSKRTMGKITFCHIMDDSGKMQIVLKKTLVCCHKA